MAAVSSLREEGTEAGGLAMRRRLVEWCLTKGLHKARALCKALW